MKSEFKGLLPDVRRALYDAIIFMPESYKFVDLAKRVDAFIEATPKGLADCVKRASDQQEFAHIPL